MQEAESGLPVPSSNPGISRNCLRISSIISWAASPTAVMERALTRNGMNPPIKSPVSTRGSEISNWKPGLFIFTTLMNAAMMAKAAKAAAPMAKPLPMAAVVLPTSSRVSVMARVSLPIPAISAMPPALSAIGP